MKDIFEHLKEVRIRPGMYLRSISIDSLESYIYGYRMCLLLHFEKETEKRSQRWFDFKDYIVDKAIWKKERNRLELPTYDCLTKSCNGDKKQALDLFFELLDQFEKEFPQK